MADICNCLSWDKIEARAVFHEIKSVAIEFVQAPQVELVSGEVNTILEDAIGSQSITRAG